MENSVSKHAWSPWILGVLRIALGWVFFWAFIDKLFGLGRATLAGKSWLDGVSPTVGFLKNAAKGPFTEMFHAMAGNAVVDWLFMLGLCGIGLALIFGVAMRVASVSGFLMVLLMWLVVLPPAQNPLVDDHIIYALVFVWFVCNPEVADTLGLGKWWSRMPFVQKMPWLR
jgi:thiosulfate dehydrogenase [quinone] large subunit